MRRRRSRARHARFALRQLDVLGGRQHRQEEEALEDEADARQSNVTPLAVPERRHIAIVEQQRAAARRVDAAEQVQERRLAAS